MSDHTPSSGTVAVIILTYNEEANIAQALSNVVGWADEVFVLDSMSTDGTLAIAKQYECHVAQHPFEDYGKQRNYALDTLPIRSEWVFFLDADESLSAALKNEIASLIATVSCRERLLRQPSIHVDGPVDSPRVLPVLDSPPVSPRQGPL